MSGGVAQRRRALMWWACSLLVVVLLALFVRPLGKGTSGVEIKNRGAAGFRIGTEEHALMFIVHTGGGMDMNAATMTMSLVNLKLPGKSSDWGKMHVLLANTNDVHVWQLQF